ncbi:phage portal protein [Pelagibacterium flavum]|uniref:Phage portal protein n=1 Tax=Pelagibacterium flavum TaxID=2984530 RepID=A0ABY6IJB1_9HYPH|nr:phage portal protein [Pelagibacterium sp. YIM 151497]UYQ70658.1 phage portal protein [Pelagibacterium sp. YIM 151497]
MGLLEYFRPKPSETKAELTDPTSESWAALLGLFSPNSSGVSINAHVAMKVPAVNAAVTAIVTSIGTLPCKVYEREEDGKSAATNHVAYTLVHDEANDWQSAGKVRELVTIDAIFHGDGFAFVNKIGTKPAEILHQPRANVTVQYLESGEPRYKIGQDIYGPDQIIHVQAPSLDGKCGMGLLASGGEAIGLAVQLEQTAARLFKNNARPGGVLSFAGKLTKDTVQRIGESWRNAHGGDKAGGVAVLDNAGTYSPIAFTSVESQHLEQRSFQIAEIARLTGVPVTMLQSLERGTFANTEQQALQFLQMCLLPWLKAWTDAYRRTLLTKAERATHVIDFVVDDLLRADIATRAEAYGKFRSMGAFTSNDVRRRENMPALPDGDSLASPYTTPGAANDNNTNREDAA